MSGKCFFSLVFLLVLNLSIGSSLEIHFFKQWDFQYHLYSSHKIPKFCQTLSEWMWRDTRSVKSEQCILLFDSEDCEGNSTRLPPGNHRDLTTFNDKAVSYGPCDRNGRNQEMRVKLYEKTQYRSLILDEVILVGCQNLYHTLWNRTASLRSPACLLLYSEENCTGGHSAIDTNMEALPSSVELRSFRPCYPNQIFSLGMTSTTTEIPKTNQTSSSDLELSVKIIKFDISADSADVLNRTKYEYMVMGHSTVFKNDGPATQTQQYSTHESTTDRMEVDLMEGLTKTRDVSISRTASKEFSSGFRQSLNLAFRNSQSVGSSTGRRTTSDVGSSATVSAGVSGGFSGFGVSANAHLDTSVSTSVSRANEKNSQTTQDDTQEESGFAQEEKNVENRISDALTSSYSNQLSGSSTQSNRLSKETTKSFTFEQSITVPPCTEYEVTTFAKKIKDFPVQYFVTVEVAGKRGGRPATSAEISSTLQADGIEVIERKDNGTVVARGRGAIIMDMSTHSFWNGKGQPIEECMENSPDAPQLPEVVFYSRPNFKTFLHKSKVNRGCQLLPKPMRNRVQSLRSDVCLILFPSKDCETTDETHQQIGYTLKVFPDQGSYLPMFANVAQAFQSCDTFRQRGRSESEVQLFIGQPNSSTLDPLVKLSVYDSCNNLETRYHQKIQGIDTNRCIVLFPDKDCQGAGFTVRPHAALKRVNEHFDAIVSSYKGCSEFDTEDKRIPVSRSIIFYDDENRSELMLQTEAKLTCTTLTEEFWKRASSFKSDGCVILYNLPLCQGQSFRAKPDQEIAASFNNQLISFVVCDHDTSVESTEDYSVDDENTDISEEPENSVEVYETMKRTESGDNSIINIPNCKSCTIYIRPDMRYTVQYNAEQNNTENRVLKYI